MDKEKKTKIHRKNTNMVDFNSLKNRASDKSSLDRYNELIDKMNNSNGGGDRQSDDRFWQPSADKSGNGSAVIRFLPPPAVDGDDALPWARVFNHGFKGPSGKWYIENSLTTIGKKDPVGEFNSKLWNESSDEDSPSRAQARAQKRRLSFVSNIYVISDPTNPDNNGKVFLYRYGKKVFDKIQEAQRPPFDENGFSIDHPNYDPKNAFVPFDFWKGANFQLRIRMKDGYRNYDSSAFDKVKPLSNDDEELKRIWNQEHSLKEFTDPKNFKSYDELKAKLYDVLEIDDGSAQTTSKVSSSKSTKAKSNGGDDVFEGASKRMSTVGDDNSPPFDIDDELSQFRKLANQQ